ncbi:MAG: FAD-dependent oxidoreductase [Proteobacteria bacterium]|nr:FAD-dependent oxidoreductase [Pseudomonadota bacterium]
MRKRDVVILGGTMGISAGMSCRNHYPDKTIAMIRKEVTVQVPCGIPYLFGTVATPEKNIIPDRLLESNQIELIQDDAIDVDRSKKVVLLASGETVGYEKLVFATGSLPLVPPIHGVDKKGVFPVQKDLSYLWHLLYRMDKVENVVIIGGGFIGVEFADECRKNRDINITVVEMLPHCLQVAMDEEFCEEAESALAETGVKIITNERVVSILGNEKVTGVELASGKKINADMVILGLGAVPNTSLAGKAGLELGFRNAVRVDRHMRTVTDMDVFACGDCAEKFSFFDGRPSGIMLASVGSSEARIVGANLFSPTCYNIGTVGVFSTLINDRAFAAAGITAKYAKETGCEIVIGTETSTDTHPAGMPGSSVVKLKLIFAKDTGVLLGGGLSGGKSVGEMINVVSACIQHRMTANDIIMFQMGTHPALTPSPIMYPLVNAACKCVGGIKSLS